MNKNYWIKYYKECNTISLPSLFASFCWKYLKLDESLLDVGCGDGRDSLFFFGKGISVTAIDWVEILALKYLSSKENNFVFKQKDLRDLKKSTDNLYLRFLLHAISKREENSILDWANKNVSKKLFIEARSIKNPVLAGHYRRLIDIEELKDKIVKMSFNILYLKESKEFSPQGDDNPILIRLIAEKIK